MGKLEYPTVEKFDTTDTPPSEGQCAVYRRFQHFIRPTVLMRVTKNERVRRITMRPTVLIRPDKKKERARRV